MYKTTYKNDKDYTDFIHNHLAIKIIYSTMKWIPKQIENQLATIKDSEYSIDYHATNKDGNSIVIQERFRRPSNSSFDDFTLRYEREEHPEEIEHKSEFFKIKGKMNRFDEPFFMVYGIVNENESGFSKYAVLNLRKFFSHYNNGKITINHEKHFSEIKDGVLQCGINYNTDKSSSFMCVSIKHLVQLFDDVVVYQEGFITEKKGDATEKQLNFLSYLASQKGMSLINQDNCTKSEASNLITLLQNSEECDIALSLHAKGKLVGIVKYLTPKKH